MTILITGSRGKTALPLTELLAPKYPVLVASRNPKPDAPHPTVRFNWHDQSTWEPIFSHPQAQKSPITAAYLVGPDEISTGSDHVISFMKLCRSKGVKRFVLLSAWEVFPGDVLMGRAHEALKKMGEEEGVEWTVLRPNFFMENFSETYHQRSIRQEGVIYSGAGDGKLAFVSTKDIAAVAYKALTDTSSHNTDYIITGPEALTYDEVAATIAEVTGRSVKHVHQDQDTFQSTLEGNIPEDMVKYMSDLDRKIANGDGREVTSTVQKVVGRPATSVREFARERKEEWL